MVFYHRAGYCAECRCGRRCGWYNRPNIPWVPVPTCIPRVFRGRSAGIPRAPWHIPRDIRWVMLQDAFAVGALRERFLFLASASVQSVSQSVMTSL